MNCKTSHIVTRILASMAFGLMPLRADDARQVPYGPDVVALAGTIFEEGYGDDASPIDRGKVAWILRLDQPVSVPAKPADEIDTEEKKVTEIHLNVDHTKHPIPKNAFDKIRFIATGTLYHAFTTHHLRPIVMLVTDLKPAGVKTKP